jgi:hypothetical protein
VKGLGAGRFIQILEGSTCSVHDCRRTSVATWQGDSLLINTCAIVWGRQKAVGGYGGRRLPKTARIPLTGRYY